MACIQGVDFTLTPEQCTATSYVFSMTDNPEGLGSTGAEAMAAGLKCRVSRAYALIDTAGKTILDIHRAGAFEDIRSMQGQAV